uniref:Crystallin zeta like 1 n=4 Tax=Catarrhini TaxID=9526 RepID=A0A2K5NWK4_CERAT
MWLLSHIGPLHYAKQRNHLERDTQ